MLQQARKDAEQTVAHMAAEADKQARNSLQAASKQGESRVAKAAQEAEQEIAALRAHAQKKEKEAIACVIAELVG